VLGYSQSSDSPTGRRFFKGRLDQREFSKGSVQQMNKHLIFIYGSLRRGSANAMSKRFPASKFVAEATIGGRLYDLGEYPGLVIGASNSRVIGEVYEVDDDLLIKLDEFEASTKYLRRQVEISFDDHVETGWTYEPDSAFHSFQTLITSGDWMEYAKTK
jgi:gamma-glutamylcyclotransferase (GGCT)/AIG2-like uncharacterized protein YtfP